MADQMSTLDSHPDFDRLAGIAAGNIGLLPELTLKDYWVTRILRAVATEESLRQQVIFKGGTSLSKGWQIIDRFSEDVDLLVTGPDFSDPPGTKAREKAFKAIRARIEQETPLRLPDMATMPAEDRNFFYSRGPYHCNIRYPLPGRKIDRTSPFTDFVLIEMGFRGGPHPHLPVTLNSFVGETILSLDEARRSELADYEPDYVAFELELLDPSRTFVEKLLATHCALAAGVDQVRTRHFYDLASLFQKRDDVRAFLQSDQFPALVKDAVRITNEYFDADIDPNLSLADSPALNLTPEQIELLARHYQSERNFYFKGQPSFADLMQTMSQIRETLLKANP